NTTATGGLRVDDRGGLVVGGNSGAAVVPGHPEKSLLVKAVGYEDDDIRMPPKKQLSAEQVAVLARWVKDGAAWPAAQGPVTVGTANPKYDRLREEHWAWQPLAGAEPPGVKNADWPR